MSDNFDAYEVEFKSFIVEFSKLADRFAYTQSDDENKKKMIEEMKRTLSLAERKYKNMETEASYIRKENVTGRLRKYLMEFEESKRRMMGIERDFLDKMGRKNLFDDRNRTSRTGQYQDIKDRYIGVNDKAYEQVGLLDDAHRDLLSAITTTQASNQVLVQDRERLIDVGEKNKNIGRLLVQAGQTEDKIYTKEICKRCILWIAIIVLFATDIFLIIDKFIIK